MVRFYKYQGAGNDFLIADNRNRNFDVKDGILVSFLENGVQWKKTISELCDRKYGVGADGFMLLDSSDSHSFAMRFFNSDGSGGMMCGNGGRCIVAFAADMGITEFDFDAPDGLHVAEVTEREAGKRIVRLKMSDARIPVRYDDLEDVSVESDGWFVNTGTNHYVRIVDGLEKFDVLGNGRKIRHSGIFAPVGTNVNFIEPVEGGIKVRTFEKGVEDETNACGTGVVASVLSAYTAGAETFIKTENGLRCDVWTLKDMLSVDFRLSDVSGGLFEDIWLTGPAVCVAEILLYDM